MAEIIPAILPEDYIDLKEKLAIVGGHTALVHIDATDATLTRHASWPYARAGEEWDEITKEEAGFPYWEEMNFEAHLMVNDPARAYEDWIRAGAERVIVHYEAFGSHEECSDFLTTFAEHFENGNEHLKVEVGLAANFETPIEKILDHVLECDFIHLMSISELGAQGEAFEEGIFDKIKELRSSYPETILAIDGGVDIENAVRLAEAGADRLVVGSAIFSADNPLETLEDLLLSLE